MEDGGETRGFFCVVGEKNSVRARFLDVAGDIWISMTGKSLIGIGSKSAICIPTYVIERAVLPVYRVCPVDGFLLHHRLDKESRYRNYVINL